jgi:biotin transport system substrate-specific component
MGWCRNVANYFGIHLNPFWTVFFANVVIFIPQDIFMDHVIAIAVFKYIHELLKQRGYDLP